MQSKTANIIIDSSMKGSFNFKDLWHYRDLIIYLTWRDISIRYKQTALGIGWAIIQPVFSMVIYTLFFGRLAKIPSDGVPYPIFSFTALLPWNYFSTAMSQSSNSVVNNTNLITKIYFPRLVIPIVGLMPALIDFCLGFVVFLGLLFYYHISLTWKIIYLPLYIILALITALGVSLWLSALNVKYRDVRYVVPFLLQLWMYASPVVYPLSIIPEKYKFLYQLNPMVGVVEGFRWALLGTNSFSPTTTILSCTFSIIILVGGLFYFSKTEKVFADVV